MPEGATKGEGYINIKTHWVTKYPIETKVEQEDGDGQESDGIISKR